jgi:thiamine-monophosphate kinase
VYTTWRHAGTIASTGRPSTCGEVPSINLRDVGEFGLIELLARELGPCATDARLIAGIGDDAMAWREGGAILLLTTDALVEGVHFRLDTTSWLDLGWKALAVNLSDIAAMGGAPDYAVVTLGLNDRVHVGDALDLYRGMRALAERTGCVVAGGDVVRSPHDVVIGVSVTGRMPAGPAGVLCPLLRSTARPGEVVAVAGWLGASAAGLWLLSHPETAAAIDSAAREAALRAHLRPEPLIEAGQYLARVGVRTAMDVSDGLLADLEKLCRASGVAATIDAGAVPVQPDVQRAFGTQALAWALTGGEDYALLVTIPADRLEQVQPGCPAPLHAIGAIYAGRPGEVSVRGLDAMLQEYLRHTRGWDHFA